MSLTIEPIAYVHTDFKEKFGIPRQSGRVSSLTGTVVFEPEFRVAQALREIESFSHLWLIFDFSQSHREKWSPTVRPPRLGGNKRIGVFASRSPFRPNPLGLSCVKLLGTEKTEHDGIVLHVGGLDLLDGTPIYDIKPYLPFADCRTEAVGGYADEYRDYHLAVDFPQPLLLRLPESKRETVLDCLSEDPRPSYQEDAQRIYSMRFMDWDIRFRVANDTVYVVAVDPLG